MKKRSRKKSGRDSSSASSDILTGSNVAPPEPNTSPRELPDFAGYDAGSLSQARTYWLFGEWDKLVTVDPNTLQHHPDRDRFALLVASAHQQLGTHDETRKYTRMALSWGCPQSLVARVLIAGVHNTLGRASAIRKDDRRTAIHFSESIHIAADDSEEAELLSHARSLREMTRLGLLPQAALLLNEQLDKVRDAQQRPQEQAARLKILESETELLHRKLDAIQSTRLPKKIEQYKNASDALNRAHYLNQNGEALYKEGKYKFALEYFERAFELDPNNAWYCQNLAEAAARLNFRKNDQWECEELGKSMDETGKWDVAVRHYRQALRLDIDQVETHRETQTFAVEPAQAGQIDNPIFIVGCGHSGTSLMLAILGNHPRIHPIPRESALFLRTDSVIQQIMREWDLECMSMGKARWIEKTPPHIFQIQRFLAFRPRAQVILMLRDGRDVVCSLKPRIGYTAFEDRLDRWIYDNFAGRFWWQHPQVKVIQYEDLITDSENTLRAICQFLGEEYRPEMLDYHKTDRRWYSDRIMKPRAIENHDDHNTNRNWQINQPIFDGRGRWQTELTETEKHQFKHSPAQALLERFGYVADSNW